METATQTTRPQPREHTLVHFEIPVSDPAKLSRFYEELFSWKFTKMPDPSGNMDYWLISHKDAGENETMGGLYKRSMGEIGFVNYFGVVNLEQSLAKATSLGATVVRGKQEIPNIGWFAIVQDPDNNTFALFQGKM
ncbi:MAG TPA: VOC family protein [Candidatus Bathyarchaeia archaeon]|nr:VOC family protein [Candidatus Bathyarchaeia archaeon]